MQPDGHTRFYTTLTDATPSSPSGRLNCETMEERRLTLRGPQDGLGALCIRPAFPARL